MGGFYLLISLPVEQAPEFGGLLTLLGHLKQGLEQCCLLRLFNKLDTLLLLNMLLFRHFTCFCFHCFLNGIPNVAVCVSLNICFSVIASLYFMCVSQTKHFKD